MKVVVVLLGIIVVVLFVAFLPSEGFSVIDAVLGGLMVLAFFFGPLAAIYLVDVFLKAGSR